MRTEIATGASPPLVRRDAVRGPAPGDVLVPAPKGDSIALSSLARAGEAIYNFAIGDDITTLRDAHASFGQKALAALSIGSNFVAPEIKGLGVAGKLAIKSADRIAPTAARTIRNVVSKPAHVANAEYVQRGWKAPHGGRNVRDFELTAATGFHRLDSGQTTGAWLVSHGQWKKLQGKSPDYLQNALSLPSAPTHVSDVLVPAGAKLRASTAAAVEGWGSGGAAQYELRTDIGRDAYRNRRPLER